MSKRVALLHLPARGGLHVAVQLHHIVAIEGDPRHPGCCSVYLSTGLRVAVELRCTDILTMLERPRP